MRTPRSRRALLISAVPIAMSIAGCFETGETKTAKEPNSGVGLSDEYDCTDVERPEPAAPARDDALEPATYPDPPDPLLDEVEQYALEFERAYRRNDVLESYGSESGTFEFEFRSRRMTTVESESANDAALVAIVYNVTVGTRQTTHPPERDTRVTYYVDESIALRARYTGLANDPEFDPDPREVGDPVACFD